MSRLKFVLFVALALLSAAKANAGGDPNATDPWNRFWTDWHRNNCWTEPFVYPDRTSVCTFFDAEIAKGWQLQCLLGDPHFEPDNSKLSPAGIYKLRAILQNPSMAHPVFVERTWNDETTSKRLAAVQRAVAEMTRGPMPEVLVSNTPLSSAPADQVNNVNTWLTTYMQTMPKPAPKAFTTDANSSGGGSGSP